MELSWRGITAIPKNSKKRPPPLNGSLSDSDDYGFETCTAEECILYNVSGVAYPGEVLALMGASGAGKTSLLNILTNRGAKAYSVSGSIRINGSDVESDVLTKISAYAQQKDVMIGAMTVKEHLMFMARLRMGEEFSDEEKEERVRNLMVELGMSHIEDTMIGWPHRLKGISGGERKRLALASEILCNPLLLFCDEPTSGLDAYFTQQVVQVLKDLARKENMTVIITIHQPSAEVFEMFDKLCLLAMGQVVYLGPPNGVYDVFKNAGQEIEEFTNAAESIIHIVALNDGDTVESNKNRLQKIRIAYADSLYGQEYERRLNDSITENRKDIGIEDRYTIEANMINMWNSIQCIPGCPKSVDAFVNSAECDLGGDGLTVLLKSYFHLNMPYIFADVGILIAMCGIYRLIGMLALYLRTKYTP